MRPRPDSLPLLAGLILLSVAGAFDFARSDDGEPALFGDTGVTEYDLGVRKIRRLGRMRPYAGAGFSIVRGKLETGGISANLLFGWGNW